VISLRVVVKKFEYVAFREGNNIQKEAEYESPCFGRPEAR
jgi:hypothetical protein